MDENREGIKLPEGTEVLDLGDRKVKSVELALEMADMGASLAMVRAVGGEEAVKRLLARRDGEPGGETVP